MDKQALRRYYTVELEQLTKEEIDTKSKLICEQALTLPALQDVRTVAVYTSFGNEVVTTGLLTSLGQRELTVVLPVVNSAAQTMEFRTMESFSSLQPGPFGIREPVHGRLCPPLEIELFFVPGLAFDPRGRRLGRGAGYYDRYLAKASPGALKIGLAYQRQIAPRLPAQPHDISMDLVITEEGIILVA